MSIKKLTTNSWMWTIIHEQILNCENIVIKWDETSCTPPIVLNINNIIIHDTLTMNDELINL
jgi:hypothetical protein